MAAHTLIGAMSGGVDGALGASTVAVVAPVLDGLQRNMTLALIGEGMSEKGASLISQALAETVAAGVGDAVKGLVVALVGNPNCGKTTLFNLIQGFIPGDALKRLQLAATHERALGYPRLAPHRVKQAIRRMMSARNPLAAICAIIVNSHSRPAVMCRP